MARRQTFPVKEAVLETLKQKGRVTFDELLDELERRGYAVKNNPYRRRAVKGLLTRLASAGVVAKEGDEANPVYVYKGE